MKFIIEGPLFGKSAVCRPILRSLPEWFGIQASILSYEAEIDSLPTFLACDSQNVFGFLSIKQHNPYSAEILVMGILPEVHRNGIGRALMNEAQSWLKKQGSQYVQVKTLGPSSDDQNYACTRAFYQAIGFKPLEEFDQIWNEQNPCLIMVKWLGF
jgi:ribosomal protein S18 acetylase RimI-like enzyme